MLKKLGKHALHFGKGNRRGKDSRVGTSLVCSKLRESVSTLPHRRQAQGEARVGPDATLQTRTPKPDILQVR